MANLLPENFYASLKTIGVGKRQFDDPYFNGNTTLAPLMKRFGIYDEDVEELCHEFVPISCDVPGCMEKFETVLDYTSHYNSVHRYPCSVCKKQLPSAHLLDLHLQEMHDSFFATIALKKPSYCCYVEECKLKFADPGDRRNHCISEHKFPHDFRYDRPSGVKKKQSVNGKTTTDAVADESNTTVKISNQAEAKPPVKISKDPVQSQSSKKFSFGRVQNKGFTKYKGKLFTNDDKASTSKSTVLNSDAVMADLQNNLPDV